jgi:5-methylcytosine-specific restriction endonuclease McrA
MSKINRQQVYDKCGGHCAYCGKDITMKQLQVDHIQAHWHTVSEEEAKRHGLTKGSHEIDNLLPSCARCNRWKATWSIEQFRQEIAKQLARLNLYSNNYRMAKDYGLLTENYIPVQFYFEKL